MRRGNLLVLLSMIGSTVFAQAQSDKPIRVALLAALFDQQQDRQQMLGQMQPFVDLVQKDLGVKSEFDIVDDVPALKKALVDGRVHLTVLPGLSFAWLRQEYAEVKPLLVASMDSTTLRAVALVAKDSPVQSLRDLRGQPAALPKRVPLFLRVFLEREWQQPIEQFVVVKDQDNAEAAIEAVIDGQVTSAILPQSAVEAYADRKPGRFKRLRVLQESPDFPLPVVAYRTAGTDLAAIKRFEKALLSADQTPEGRQTLTLWRLRGFVKPPADFDELIIQTARRYPMKAGH
jgi:ABC-type phosphate/phosphonate transport system substrate-binding protein